VRSAERRIPRTVAAASAATVAVLAGRRRATVLRLGRLLLRLLRQAAVVGRRHHVAATLGSLLLLGRPMLLLGLLLRVLRRVMRWVLLLLLLLEGRRVLRLRLRLVLRWVLLRLVGGRVLLVLWHGLRGGLGVGIEVVRKEKLGRGRRQRRRGVVRDQRLKRNMQIGHLVTHAHSV
jgi:hypothetical protein